MQKDENKQIIPSTPVGSLFRLNQTLSFLCRGGVLEVFVGTLLATLFAFKVLAHVDQSLFLWPVSAVTLSLSLPYWHQGWQKRATLQFAAALGFLLGAYLVGMPLWLSCMLTVLIIIDVSLGILVLGPDLINFNHLKRRNNIRRFMTLIVIVPAFTGTIAAFPLSHFIDQSIWKTALMIVFSGSLGFAVLVPTILLIKSDNYRGTLSLLRSFTPKVYLSMALFLLVSGLVFWQEKGPFLFMVFPPMVIVVFCIGFEGAVLTTLALCIIGTVSTFNGHGPIMLMKGSPLDLLLALQAFVWVNVLLALPIGALLDEHKKAQKNIENALKEKSLALMENHCVCARLKTSNDRFMAFMANGPFASYIKDAEGRMLFYNKYFAQSAGVTETAWLGLKDDEIWPTHMASSYRESDVAVLATNRPAEFDDVSPCASGGSVFWKSYKFPFFDEESQRFVLAAISFDITTEIFREAALEDALREKTKIYKQLESSGQLLENFLHSSPNLTYIKDDRCRYVFYNREVEKFFGISATEWIGRSIAEVRPKREADRTVAEYKQVLATGCNVETIDEMEDQCGVKHKFRSIKFAYKDMDGRTMLARMSVDITSQLKHEEELDEKNRQLELLAMTDSLTGLATLRLFESRAVNEFAISRRSRRPVSILLMDIDNFKLRNDKFGHAAGDQALKMIGTILKTFERAGDLVARLGGEEFGMLLPETTTQGAATVARRIQSVLSRADHGPVPLTLSIGVASRTPASPTWKEVLAKADEAMYVAKRTGKNRIVSYKAVPTSLAKTA